MSVGPGSASTARHAVNELEPPSEKVEDGQAVQAEEPVAVPYVPLGQARHVAEPAGEYDPGRHATQTEEDVAPTFKDAVPAGQAAHALADTLQNVPSGQGSQLRAPAAVMYRPRGQVSHVMAPGAPMESGSRAYVLMAHSKHDCWPEAGAYVPAGHACHWVPPGDVTIVPGGATVQEDALAREYEPAEQFVQLEAPLAEYIPAEHSEQKAAPAPEYVPGQHGVQLA